MKLGALARQQEDTLRRIQQTAAVLCDQFGLPLDVLDGLTLQPRRRVRRSGATSPAKGDVRLQVLHFSRAVAQLLDAICDAVEVEPDETT